MSYDVVIYDLDKRDDIVTQRDTVTNFTQRVNAGRTSHRGVEPGAGLPFAKRWRADAALSYSHQKYEELSPAPAISAVRTSRPRRVCSATRA